MEGLEKEMRSSLEDGGPAVHGDWGAGWTRALRRSNWRAGLPGWRWLRPGSGFQKPKVQGRSGGLSTTARYRAGVVTKEPHPGEEASYGPGMPLVVEWRHLWSVREEGTRLTQTKGRERIMALEIAMIGEYELTLPPDTAPLHPSVREDYLGWRRRALVEYRGSGPGGS